MLVVLAVTLTPVSPAPSANGVIVLVAMPDPRYLDPAAVLLPSVVTTAIYVVVSRLCRAAENPDAAPQGAGPVSLKCH